MWRQCALPSNRWFPGPTQLSIPNCISIGTAVLHSSQHRVRILYNGPWFSLKLPLHVGDLRPHLTRDSLAPPESISQTASRMVQPFFQGSRTW